MNRRDRFDSGIAQGLISRARRAVRTLQREPNTTTRDVARRALSRIYEESEPGNRMFEAIEGAIAALYALYPYHAPFVAVHPADLDVVLQWLDYGFPLQRYARPITTHMARDTVQVCDQTGQAFVSLSDACRVLGISRGMLARYRRGELPNADGYSFHEEPAFRHIAQRGKETPDPRRSTPRYASDAANVVPADRYSSEQRRYQ
jgi:hypothetical protein